MKRMLSAVLLSSLSAVSLSSYAEEKPLFDFKGHFAYQMGGYFNNPASTLLSGAGKLTEIGVFHSDGRGRITAEGYANIVNADLSSTLASGPVRYHCTYTDVPSMVPFSYMIEVSCTRTQDSSVSHPKFILSMVKNIGITKQFVRILALPGEDFGNVSIIGQANSSEFQL